MPNQECRRSKQGTRSSGSSQRELGYVSSGGQCSVRDNLLDLRRKELNPFGDEVGQGRTGHRTADARTFEAHADRRPFDCDKAHVTTVGLNRRPHFFNGGHDPTLEAPRQPWSPAHGATFRNRFVLVKRWSLTTCPPSFLAATTALTHRIFRAPRLTSTLDERLGPTFLPIRENFSREADV